MCKGSGARGPEECLPLTPAVLGIVLALGDEELHGYAIMARSKGLVPNARPSGAAGGA